MIGNFIKALFRPTQFVYKKSGMPLYFSNKATLTTKQHKSNSAPSQNDNLKLYLQSVDTTSKNSASSFAPNINSTLNTTNVDSFKPAPIPKILSDIPLTKPTPLPIVETAQKPISPLPKSVNKNNGLPNVPDYPNLITGITKDPRGNALSNILIEVKDKENNPVRAFKTSDSGRFASATPLINGVYTIEFEDLKGQNKFEPKTINITGQIILPIVAISIDTREELRRSLFAKN